MSSDRYRVDARCLPFTPSWFWEVIDTDGNAFVANSLGLSRTVYASQREAVTAGHDYLHVTIGTDAPDAPRS